MSHNDFLQTAWASAFGAAFAGYLLDRETESDGNCRRRNAYATARRLADAVRKDFTRGDMGDSMPSATRSCRLCQGGLIAPWPPGSTGNGPTHHTCHPGEEAATLDRHWASCDDRSSNSSDLFLAVAHDIQETIETIETLGQGGGKLLGKHIASDLAYSSEEPWPSVRRAIAGMP